MNAHVGRLAAVSLGAVAAVAAYVAYPAPVLAATAGAFWTVAALLARRNWRVVRRRGSRWAGAYGGLSTLAAAATFAVAASLPLPDAPSLGFALGAFVLGVAAATAGVGVEMATERVPNATGDGASESDSASDAPAVPDDEDASTGG